MRRSKQISNMEIYPFVSIIIPVRNVGKIIGQCLESLKNLNYPMDKYEVIISDSESSDNTQEVVKKYAATLVSTPKRSVVAGRNEGFKIAKGDFVAFSDADCVMDKNWIQNSLKYFEDPKIGAVGGPNITPDDDKPFAKAVGFVFDQPIFTAGSVYGRILKNTKEVKSIPGCNVIYRRESLDKVMPMDETLLEAEDYVTNQKIRYLGYKLLYTPDTIVWHYRRPSPKKFFRQMHRYAIGRLLIGKKDRKMINLTHIAVGLGLPIVIGFSAFLIAVNYLWFIYFALSACIFLTAYFFTALLKIKSLKASLWVPPTIVIMFLAWSLGFLRELFFPINSRK